MNPLTLQALRGSIAKWQKVVDGTGPEMGARNCPLCQMFITEPDCGGCPVALRTGLSGCRGTPYDTWADLELDGDGDPVDEALAKQLAQAELDFLISLLPEGESV